MKTRREKLRAREGGPQDGRPPPPRDGGPQDGGQRSSERPDALAGAALGEARVRSSRAGISVRVPTRLRVTKAYKMFVNGAFIRSESGRSFQVGGGPADPATVNVPLGSRKDVRDAVLVARAAAETWAGRTAYNRGQILYRLAEVMDARRDELEAQLARGGASVAEASAEVDVAVDRAIFYAGFCDKYQALLASSNPVAGPHFAFSVPEPMGVVGIVAPCGAPLLGLVSSVLPVVCGGNVTVVVTSEEDPRTAVVWSECLATSDLPAGVINVLTGRVAELAPQLARHRDVNAISAFVEDGALRALLQRDASGSVKRVKVAPPPRRDALLASATGQGIGWIEAFLETKSIWHPVGI